MVTCACRGMSRVGGTRDAAEDSLEQGFEVLGGQLAVAGVVQGALAGLSGSVHDGDVHEGVHVDVDALVHEVLAEGEQQVGRLGDDLVDTRVGAVNLVDDDDDGQVSLEGLAQDEAGLREWAFGGVNHEDDAVDHGQAALNLAAEVGVAGGVDHVDGDSVLKAQGLGGGAAIVDGGVLARMVMPFSRSRSPESMTRSPVFSTVSRSENAPDCQSIASTSVVLP